MNGLVRRRIAVVGLCLCLAGCAAHKIPLEPFASDDANSTPPATITDATAAVSEKLQSSVDHGPPPASPYAKGTTPASNTAAATNAHTSRAATPGSFNVPMHNVSTHNAPTLNGSKQSTAAPSVAGDAAALAAVMAELQAIGPIDPAVQARLLEDLRQTDPAVWPTLMQTFKAGIAYRQRAATNATAQAASLQASSNTEPKNTEPKNTEPKQTEPKPTATAPPPQPATIPPSVIAQLKQSEASSPFANLPLDALGGGGMTPRNGGSPGLALPTQTILQAAMAEAQRRDEEQSHVPPKVSVAATLVKCEPEDATTKSQAAAPTIDLVSHTETTIDAPVKTEALASPAVPVPAVPLQGDAVWRESLGLVITGLEAQTREAPHSAAEVSRHAWLRMLYLAAGRREDALKPIPGIAAAEQDFWSEQIYGLATYLDTEKVTDPARRSAEARSHLAKAEKRLSEASTLSVRSLAFCTEVSSYGVYEKFKDYRFKAGQPLILYSEVENFRSEESAKGFHTALRSSYQILDPQGRRVAENDLALTEEYCQNERRDYFIRYFLSVPERIYDGKYTLQLTIVDTLSQKIGQSTIDFTVGEEKKTP